MEIEIEEITNIFNLDEICYALICQSDITTLINLYMTNTRFRNILNKVVPILGEIHNSRLPSQLTFPNFIECYDCIHINERSIRYYSIEDCAAIAAYDGNPQMINWYINQGANNFYKIATRLAMGGHQHLLVEFFQQYPNLGPYYNRILCMASHNGHLDLIFHVMSIFPMYEWDIYMILNGCIMSNRLDVLYAILDRNSEYHWNIENIITNIVRNKHADMFFSICEKYPNPQRNLIEIATLASLYGNIELITRLIDSSPETEWEISEILYGFAYNNHFNELQEFLNKYSQRYTYNYDAIAAGAAGGNQQELMYHYLRLYPNYNWDYNIIGQYCCIADNSQLLFDLMEKFPNINFDLNIVMTGAVLGNSSKILSEIFEKYPQYNWDYTMLKQTAVDEEFHGIHHLINLHQLRRS